MFEPTGCVGRNAPDKDGNELVATKKRANRATEKVVMVHVYIKCWNGKYQPDALEALSRISNGLPLVQLFRGKKTYWLVEGSGGECVGNSSVFEGREVCLKERSCCEVTERAEAESWWWLH